MEKLGPGDPQRIGAYRLLARLGAGGMGNVYLARSERGRTVAVKLVRQELAEQEEFRARFRQEVRAARQVGGYWTAPVLDADTEAGIPWVATGYVAGPSLHAVVGRDHGALPERSVRILAAGLAHALEDIHAAGLIHRDLKPSNVLVTIDGPRVIDFGIARALETVTDGGLTRTGALVGSPGFMAPEQVRGDRITPACDVFCLGSVLAYAATGNLPFGAANSGVHALMFRIAQEEPDLAGLPEGLYDIVRDCLRKDPAARPTLAQILQRTGAEDTVFAGRSRDPWLPSALVAQLGRHAVRLLDTEDPEETGVTGAGEGSGAAGEPGGEVDPGSAGGAAAAEGGPDVPGGPEGGGRPTASSASAGPAAGQSPGAAGQFPTPPSTPPAAPPSAPPSVSPSGAAAAGPPPSAPPVYPLGDPHSPYGGSGGSGAPGSDGATGPATTPDALGSPVEHPAAPPGGAVTPPPGASFDRMPTQIAGSGGAQPSPPGAPPHTPPAPAGYGFPQPYTQQPAGGYGQNPAPGYGQQPGAVPGPGPGPAYGYPHSGPQASYGAYGQGPYAGGQGPAGAGGAGLGATPPYGPEPLYGPGAGPGGRPDPERGSRRSSVLLVAVALVVALGAGGSVYALMKKGDGAEDNDAKGGTRTSAPETLEPTTDGPTTPETSPGPTTESPDAGTIPEGFLGTWNATLDGSSGSDTRQLVIQQGEVGDTVLSLTADGPLEGGGTYHCVFEAALTNEPSDAGPLEIGPSTVTTGEPAESCSPGAATTVTLLPDGSLRRVDTAGKSVTYEKSA
ncbi:serine/threonine protein kinase [Streptomyces sp. ID01-12c]|uniref:serine/threonine-protein kinase n=1 Tax=Streptomyces caniscabiei TaxID=2746961 RepID=UPI001781E5E8|nr:serine/threonine-protein kinase [Streptomyces caniscabiei]MBD9703540.1 serine/threonine protein kinase [Streptomyces caniscabiei]MDX3726802.1 serine/threonine-protein kinase [Streptomyces caniscabiei]